MIKLFRYVVEWFEACIHSPTSLVGLAASAIVLVSMCFNTRSRRGSILMRLINLLGSVVCVIYALMLGPDGIGTLILNFILIFVNLYYLTLAVKHK